MNYIYLVSKKYEHVKFIYVYANSRLAILFLIIVLCLLVIYYE